MSRPISHLSNKWDALGGDFEPSRCEKIWGNQDPCFSHLVIHPVLPEESPARGAPVVLNYPPSRRWGAPERDPLWIPSHEPDPWATVRCVGVINDAEPVSPIDSHVSLRAR